MLCSQHILRRIRNPFSVLIVSMIASSAVDRRFGSHSELCNWYVLLLCYAHSFKGQT